MSTAPCGKVVAVRDKLSNKIVESIGHVNVLSAVVSNKSGDAAGTVERQRVAARP